MKNIVANGSHVNGDAGNVAKLYPNGAPSAAEKVKLPLGVMSEAQIRLTAPPQIIKGMVPLDGTSLCVGQSSAGKSFICIDMAVAVATGAPFFGHPVKNHGGVYYLAAEGGGIGRRIMAAKIHRDIDQDIPLVFKAKACNLKEDKELDCFIRELRQTGEWLEQEYGVPLRLVIMDTMSVAFTFENENDNAQVADVCKRLQRINAETGAHAMGIHHAGKNQEAGARGASAWRANVDNMLFCAAERDENTGECTNRQLNISKYRDGDEGPVSGYELRKIILGKDEDGEPFDSCAIEATDKKIAKAQKFIPPNQRIFEAALSEALIADGREICAYGDGPKVRAVTVKRVKEEFWKRHGTGEDDDKKRDEATRKAFRRELKSGRHVIDASGEAELIWRKAQLS